MITKLKPVSGGTFPGAAYNESKVKEGVAKLAGHANIDANFLHTLRTLHSVGIDCGNEVEQYLQNCSQTYGNTKSTRWQLHLALSCKGKEKNKEQLVGIVHAMMKEYGADKQPYFIYFHQDTANNHVHILSTRVDSRGRMLSDHHDYARLNKALNTVITNDMRNDLDRMFGYIFTTEGQLMNIARGFNYKVGESEDNKNILVFYHGGAEAFAVSRDDVVERIAEIKRSKREKERLEFAARQMKAIFIKYREKSLEQELPVKTGKKAKVDGLAGRAKTKKDLMEKKAAKIHPDIKKLKNADGKALSKTEQYQLNWLVETLRSKFGISVHFQKDKNGVVRGYGIVDHNNKVALNGSEVMKLADIVNFKEWQAAQKAKAEKVAKAKAEKAKVEKPVTRSYPWQQKPTAPSQAQTPAKPQNLQEPVKTHLAQETVRQPKPKARIYQPDSTLDIYRPLFKVGLGKLDGKKIIRMQLDGNTNDHVITDNQSLWYTLAPAEAREDIAIRLAVFYFYREIYDSYRRQLKDLYVKHESEGMDIPKGHLRAYKQRNGLWCVALDYKGNTMQYVLSVEESKLMNRADVDGNKSEFTALKERIFKEKVAQHEANDIASHLNYEDMKVYPSYAKDKDNISNVKSFVSQHLKLMQGLMNALSVNVGDGFNREFEVGGRRNRWDEIDDDRRFRGGLSM